jgi:hypothetical protein
VKSCGGRMTVRAVVTDPAAIAKLLGAPRHPRAPARRRLTSSRGHTRDTSRPPRPCPTTVKRAIRVQPHWNPRAPGPPALPGATLPCQRSDATSR